MTTLLHETWEGGTNGAACTTSNTAWNGLITHWTFDNTHVPTGQGSLSGKVVAAAQTAQARANLTTAADRGYEELWVWAAALPTSDTTIASFRTTGSAANLAELRLAADGTISIRNSSSVTLVHTAAAAFHTSQWMKIQRSYDNVAGQQRLRVFWTNTASSTPDYDSGMVTSTGAGQIGLAQIGVVNATTWTAWFGDYTLDDTAWPSTGGTGSGGTVAERASASSTATDSGHTISVTVPSSVVAGDVMVLQFVAGQQTTQTGPSGWASLNISQSGNNVAFDAWQKTAVAGDIGATVTVTSNNTSSFTRQLHLNVSTGKVGACSSRMESTATAAHSTPQVTAVDPQAWLLQGCMDRGSPPSTGFTLPSNLTQRTIQTSTATAGVSSVTATDDVVGSGSVGANTITGTLATSKAATWTVALEPTTTTLSFTVSAGTDLTVEPWRTLTITPTATTTPDSWSWSQLSGVAAQGYTTPGTVTDMTSGATVDANGTIHLTVPAAIVPMQYTLKVSAHKAGVSPDPADNMVLSVYPATRWFVSSTGELKPIRYQQVT